MKALTNLQRSVRLLGRVSCVLACAITVQAAAQARLDPPGLTIPPESRKPATDIRAEKTATARGFEISVGNHGTDTVTGIVVTERAGSGRACPAATTVTITGSGVPEGRFTLADLTGSGITLSPLSGDQLATISYSCGVN
jgi:hypothetical protein